MPGLFFNQKLDSISKVTRDKWGDMTTTIIYQSVPCRFTNDTSRIRGGFAEQELADALAYIGPKYTVVVDYVVVYENEEFLVFKVFGERDLFGNIHHKKLLLKSR